MKHALIESPLGPILIRVDRDALVGLYFEDQKGVPALPSGSVRDDADPVVRRTAAALAQCFAGHPATDMPPIRFIGGTVFQRAVWEALSAIPRGETTSYGVLAHRIGRPEAIRAVGAAVGRNPVSILVPCHRVVGRQGQLTGYAGGLARKARLLALEGVPGVDANTVGQSASARVRRDA
jgi:methylated-DNA-[protein]-cysteine S-methyltransferase